MDDLVGKPVVGGKPRTRWQLWWLAVALVVVIIAMIVTYVVTRDRPAHSGLIDSVNQNAQQATEQGDYNKAFTDLQTLEGVAMTKEQKARYYGDLAAAAANTGKIKEAIEYLQKKHELNPDAASADAFMLATLYANAGDTVRALAQYRTALEYAKSQPETEASAGKITALETLIAELEGAGR